MNCFEALGGLPLPGGSGWVSCVCGAYRKNPKHSLHFLLHHSPRTLFPLLSASELLQRQPSFSMTNQTTAARAGRLVGISYRETARVLRMIDWREVGSIVLRCLVALVVLTYVLGEATGRWTHRTNDGLAALWVQAVGCGSRGNDNTRCGSRNRYLRTTNG
jgi:hypothetical protein